MFGLSLKECAWRFESDEALLAQFKAAPELRQMMIEAHKDDVKLQQSVQLVKKCRNPVCWAGLNEHKVIGPNIVKEIEEKVQIIQQRLKTACNRQKSYADLKRKDIEYEVRDKVFLKVSPWRKILRVGKKGKSSPRFIRPYEILERIGTVAYCLALPPVLAKLHDVFHVSMLH